MDLSRSNVWKEAKKETNDGKKGRWDWKGISERCWIRIGDHDRRAATYFLADTSGLAFLRGWWARKQDNEGRKPFHRLCMRFSDSLPRSSQRSADVLFGSFLPLFFSYLSSFRSMLDTGHLSSSVQWFTAIFAIADSFTVISGPPQNVW